MLRNCTRCGKVHTYPTKLCRECRNTETESYKKVKNYLWNNPNSTVDEIHEATGIDKKLIRNFVREGRFLISKGTFIEDD